MKLLPLFLLCTLLLSACEPSEIIPEPLVAFPSTFQLTEDLTLPSAPDTFQEIIQVMENMVEHDVMSMEVPYPCNLIELGIYSSYEYAYRRAYQNVNATHIEYTSNTRQYLTGYRIDTQGNFFMTFSRQDPLYSQEDISHQNEFFRQEVQAIFQELQDQEIFSFQMPPLDQIKVLFDFTMSHLSYDYEIPEISFTAYGTVTVQKVVCQGYVALFNALLKLAGFQAEGVIGTATDNGEGHIWTRVLLDDGWHHFDPTFADRPTWTPDQGELLYNYVYFDMTEETMLYDRNITHYLVNNETLTLP